jgi:imidazolonepropionase-like amidohydrolase
MDRTRYIVAGSFIDGSEVAVRRNVFLKLQGTIITAIGPAANLPRSKGTAVHDLSHCTILPPLVDCSVSLTSSPSVDSRVRQALEEAGSAKKAALATRHIRYCYTHGVLGVAASDDIPGSGKNQQEVMARGSLIDVRTSGGICRSREDCAARSQADTDFLKIDYSGDTCPEEVPGSRINREDLRSILGQRVGKKAVVVTNGRERVQEALAAGCDAIEQGYNMGEDNLGKMAELDVLWIPSVLMARNGLDSAGSGGDVTCRFSLRYAAPGKPDPGAENFWKRMLAGQLEQLRLARNLGVKTAVGTGAGSVGILHGESVAEEMKLFTRAGYSPEEAIRCGSDNGARFFGMENLGALAVGRKATFLAARGTVQQLLRKLAFLEAVYVEGELGRSV